MPVYSKEILSSSCRVFTTDEEIDFAIEAMTKGVNHMRELSPIWEMYKEGIDLNSVVWSEH